MSELGDKRKAFHDIEDIFNEEYSEENDTNTQKD
jgi:hypothetical protein